MSAERIIFVYALLHLVFVVRQVAPQTYRRERRGLVDIPTDIPPDTVHLLLSRNLLANASYGILEGLALKHIDLSRNELPSFPNLTVVGATLTKLDVGGNKYREIPPELLEDLVVLEELSIKENYNLVVFPDLSAVGATLLKLDLYMGKIAAIEAADVEPLTALRDLKIGAVKNLASYDLSALGDTLTLLETGGCCQVNPWSLEYSFTSFTRLQTLDIRSRGLQEFPEISTTCSSLKKISFSENSIVEIKPEYIDDCIATEDIGGGKNLLQALPNITVMGNTLVKLDLHTNNISVVDQDFMRAQKALEYLRMTSNRLTEFPDVSECAGTLARLLLGNNLIPTVDPAISGAMTALVEVDLRSNLLTELPDFSFSNTTLTKLILSSNRITNLSPSRLGALVRLQLLKLEDNLLTSLPDLPLPKLKTLHLENNLFPVFPAFSLLGNNIQVLRMSNNSIRAISRIQFTGLNSLKNLSLDLNPLQSVPDVGLVKDTLLQLVLSNTPIRTATPRVASQLGGLAELDLSFTQLQSLPSACPGRDFRVILEDNENLDLCSSEMAWLKQDFFIVNYTDVTCVELEKNWSNATLEELTALPHQYRPGDTREMMTGGSVANTLCRWPTAGVRSSMSLGQCSQLCLEDPTCSSFNYNQGQRWCAPVVSKYSQPLEGNNTGWEFHGP